MEIVPFVHEGLGNSSYLVALGGGRAFLVDPDRTAGRYLQAAERRGWRIEAVFETHLHADFVTGAGEVTHATGAGVYISAESGVRLPHTGLKGGDRLTLDGLEVEVISSPGHSPESLSYVFRAAGAAPALFSGGAMTAGSAARTDLVSPEFTEPLTRALFQTIRNAYNHLPDETLLLPTHGSGSFCTAGGGGERTSTLGRERQTNALLMYDDEDEFLRWFPTTFPAIPAYFMHMRALNQAGPRLRKEIPMPGAMPPEEFRAAAHSAVIVDVRPTKDYANSHIPGSLSNAFRSSYATWLGWLVPLGAPLLFVTGSEPLDQVIDESLLVGQENFAGMLDGGIDAWRAAGYETASVERLQPRDLRRLAAGGLTLLDVREPDEFSAGRIQGALHIPLGSLAGNLDRIPRDRPVVAYCGKGERSATAASILERAGFAGVRNLEGGIAAWRAAGQPVTV